MNENESLENIIKKMKAHPKYKSAGMILYHNGIVRNSSRAGEPVSGLEIFVDHENLNDFIEKQKLKPGIVEILIHIVENKVLIPGDYVMYLAVAGDIRENVTSVMKETLELVKTKYTTKKEHLL